VPEATWAKHAAVQLHEHRHNFKQGSLQKSKLHKHASEEGHRIDWNEARILEIKVMAGIENRRNQPTTCLTNPIGQHIVDTSPI
jgi:hypothetical protein